LLTQEPAELHKGDESSDEADSHLDDEHPYRPALVNADQQTNWLSRLRTRYRQFSLTSVQKNVLKCCIAYTLASLFTFVRPLSDFVGLPFDADGPVANAHFIATIATYFNPARTMGSLTEANCFMLWAAFYSLFVCFGSMATAVVLNNDDLEWLSHTVVLIFWLGGSSGFAAYMKSSVGRPTFGSAISMTILIVSSVCL
jgi:hypothetical protein